MRMEKGLQCFFRDRLYTKFTLDVGASSLEWRNAMNVRFENTCTRSMKNVITKQALMMLFDTNMFEA